MASMTWEFWIQNTQAVVIKFYKWHNTKIQNKYNFSSFRKLNGFILKLFNVTILLGFLL